MRYLNRTNFDKDYPPDIVRDFVSFNGLGIQCFPSSDYIRRTRHSRNDGRSEFPALQGVLYSHPDKYHNLDSSLNSEKWEITASKATSTFGEDKFTEVRIMNKNTRRRYMYRVFPVDFEELMGGDSTDINDTYYPHMNVLLELNSIGDKLSNKLESCNIFDFGVFDYPVSYKFAVSTSWLAFSLEDKNGGTLLNLDVRKQWFDTKKPQVFNNPKKHSVELLTEKMKREGHKLHNYYNLLEAIDLNPKVNYFIRFYGGNVEETKLAILRKLTVHKLLDL